MVLIAPVPDHCFDCNFYMDKRGVNVGEHIIPISHISDVIHVCFSKAYVSFPICYTRLLVIVCTC